MSSVAELQKNGEHCFRMAEAARDPHIKASWARLAEAWFSLADQQRQRESRAWMARPTAEERVAAIH